ncbi:MAG: hypothetical protein HON32_01370, partial [Francisellaceae bacterium]|nr:hypothetical protein [Francisellaceae bacterium]
ASIIFLSEMDKDLENISQQSNTMADCAKEQAFQMVQAGIAMNEIHEVLNENKKSSQKISNAKNTLIATSTDLEKSIDYFNKHSD